MYWLENSGLCEPNESISRIPVAISCLKYLRRTQDRLSDLLKNRLLVLRITVAISFILASKMIRLIGMRGARRAISSRTG